MDIHPRIHLQTYHFRRKVSRSMRIYIKLLVHNLNKIRGVCAFNNRGPRDNKVNKVKKEQNIVLMITPADTPAERETTVSEHNNLKGLSAL